MDILDMTTVSHKGNRYLLVVVDRATKFLVAFAPPTKETLGVSRKLLELILIFGLPLSIRCDPGRENTSEIKEHLCRWLKVPLDFVPANHPRGQGTVERMGKRCCHSCSRSFAQGWPERWDEYSMSLSRPGLTGCSRTRACLDTSRRTRCCFGRSPRTPLDQLVPTLDNSGPALGLERTVEETRRKTHRSVQGIPESVRPKRTGTGIFRTHTYREHPPELKRRRGDKVLVRESASTLHRDGVHPKLAHDHFTGPWNVVNVVRAGLSFTIRLHGRQIRQRTVAALPTSSRSTRRRWT